jgi:hypothetical protein
MTKAGQAQMAKQGAPSASKLAAKRVDKNIGGKLSVPTPLRKRLPLG